MNASFSPLRLLRFVRISMFVKWSGLFGDMLVIVPKLTKGIWEWVCWLRDSFRGFRSLWCCHNARETPTHSAWFHPRPWCCCLGGSDELQNIRCKLPHRTGPPPTWDLLLKNEDIVELNEELDKRELNGSRNPRYLTFRLTVSTCWVFFQLLWPTDLLAHNIFALFVLFCLNV